MTNQNLLDKTILLQNYMFKNYSVNVPTSVAEQIIKSASNSGSYVSNIGKEYFIQGFGYGNTILVNGKDITGNLGSSITYGNQSPIISGNKNNVSYSENLSQSSDTTSAQVGWHQTWWGISVITIVSGLILALILRKFKQ